MKLEIHHYHHLCESSRTIERLLERLVKQGEKIMATQQELTTQLNDVNEKLSKIGGETSTLLTKIEELKAIIESGPEVSPELQAAVDAVSQQAGVVDDLVPDAS